MSLTSPVRPARPWLTVILDDHSRAVAGYTVFLGEPTTAQTALALRQAIWRKSRPGLGGVRYARPRCTAITAPTSPAPTWPRCAPT